MSDLPTALPDAPGPAGANPGEREAEDTASATAIFGRFARLSNRHKDWLRYAKLIVRRARIRFAHFILLPELSPDQAFDLRQTVRKDGALTRGYVLMCALAAGIAMLGLLQSSTAVVIGAMLVSPLMSPIAALGFGFASLDGHRIRDAIRVVAIGAAIGILTGMLLTWLSPIRNATPEILARTQPNLLDLAIALFSGVAGGYATVIGKGGTAIGVAIATALMPPLTVVGYGIGVLQPMFALGALLLFLTNLAAITFAVAVMARLSGAARPFGKVEWTPRYIAVMVVAFLVLATPLSMTLMQLTAENRIRLAARSAIVAACGGPGNRNHATIAQLDVQSRLFGSPKVTALVIAHSYTGNAETDAQGLLKKRLHQDVDITLQQVLAADVEGQTRAMVDAAMERTAAGIAADVPPYKAIRQSIGLPTHSIWTDRAQRMVYVEPMPAPDWSLGDYRTIEQRSSADTDGWTVRVLPPIQTTLHVALGLTPPAQAENAQDTVSPTVAAWALQRWGLASVHISGVTREQAAPLLKALDNAGISAELTPPQDTNDKDGGQTQAKADPVAVLAVYPESPSRQAAEAAAAQAADEARAALEARQTPPAKAPPAAQR